MTYPAILLEGYWNNQITYTPQFTRIEMKEGGVIHRSRSQIINTTRKSWSFQGVLKDRDTVDEFLRNRNGLPLQYQGATYTCLEWTWTWLVFVSGVGGAWELSGTFIEDFNPQAESEPP